MSAPTKRMMMIAAAPPRTALETEALYFAHHWDARPQRDMETQLMACVHECAATNDVAALRILHEHAFSVEKGLETSLAAGHTALLDLLLLEKEEKKEEAPLLRLGGGAEAPLWLAAARAVDTPAAFAVLERLHDVYGAPRVPAGPAFLKVLYGSAPLAAVRWLRAQLRSAGRLPPLHLAHLGECARNGRVEVLRLVLGEEAEEAALQDIGPQDLADCMLNYAVCAPVFPLELATLLCAGALCPRLLPAVSESGRSLALGLAAGRLPALQFLLQLDTPWPARLLPAFAAAAEYASLDRLLDAVSLAFPEEEEKAAAAAEPGAEMVFALTSALGHLRYQARRLSFSAQQIVAALERRIETGLAESRRPPKRKAVHWKDEVEGAAAERGAKR